MHSILALIIFNFDMKIDPDYQDWIQAPAEKFYPLAEAST
jgi:hypothetical protein